MLRHAAVHDAAPPSCECEAAAFWRSQWLRAATEQRAVRAEYDHVVRVMAAEVADAKRDGAAIRSHKEAQDAVWITKQTGAAVERWQSQQKATFVRINARLDAAQDSMDRLTQLADRVSGAMQLHRAITTRRRPLCHPVSERRQDNRTEEEHLGRRERRAGKDSIDSNRKVVRRRRKGKAVAGGHRHRTTHVSTRVPFSTYSELDATDSTSQDDTEEEMQVTSDGSDDDAEAPDNSIEDESGDEDSDCDNKEEKLVAQMWAVDHAASDLLRRHPPNE